MKVLVSGDGDSIFIKGYIENVLLDNDSKVFLLTDDLNNKKWMQFYNHNNVVIINKKVKMPIIRHIPKFRGIINQIFIIIKLRKLGSFDAIHVHFISKSKCFFLPYIRRRATNIILTYWGSDLLRRSYNEIRSMKKYVDLADKITFSTKKLKMRFNTVFGEIYRHKTSIVKFGSDNFEAIDRIRHIETLDESKKRFGIPEDKIIIVIGYNRNKKQQQLEIVNQINLLDNSIIEKLCIVYPMTYGPTDEDYEDELKSINSTLPCKVIYLYEYMYNDDIARLCLSTDILIHAQVTDAFSATVQEFLYADVILINGGWLDYTEFDMNNIKYTKFNKFEDLKGILEKKLENIENEKKDLGKNRDNLINLSSWAANRDRWLRILDYHED